MKRQVNDGKWVWCARGSKTDRVILSVNLRFFHLGSRAFAWIIEYKYVQLSPSKPLYAICCPSLSRRKPVAPFISAFILCVAKMYLFCFIFFNLLYSILDVFYFLFGWKTDQQCEKFEFFIAYTFDSRMLDPNANITKISTIWMELNDFINNVYALKCVQQPTYKSHTVQLSSIKRVP